jgi:hypothetical protein
MPFMPSEKKLVEADGVDYMALRDEEVELLMVWCLIMVSTECHQSVFAALSDCYQSTYLTRSHRSHTTTVTSLNTTTVTLVEARPSSRDASAAREGAYG